jgi:succinyl-CoA synthetase beta subunit
LKIHEYQAKHILNDGGVPIPRGEVSRSSSEAKNIAERIGGVTVVKAQIHAGGRGKAGGIKVVSSPDDAALQAGCMLGTKLVTGQTGPEGVIVDVVLVEEALDIERELYLGIVIDGAARGPVMIASQAGGMDIEDVAENTPEKIVKISVDPALGLQPYQARKIAYSLGIEQAQLRAVTLIIENTYRIFCENDCSLVEINPLVVVKDGRVLAADAKLNFDDDALFKHPSLQELHDPAQDDPLEALAADSGISYVKLDGDVGCMVNGAGLAMATMDVIGQSGSGPANFLDVGGGADESKVSRALTIIFSDQSVKAVLVNIFGGILRCDVVARGIIQAVNENPDIDLPIVVRMLGTNANEGREILSASGLNVILVDNLADAATAMLDWV